ncbi:MAG: N-acetyltransferase, partial [Rhizobiaceae bacterium]
LGPLAVSPDFQGAGLGSALMRAAIEAAQALGHGAVILVGDAAYYARFGFSAALTGNLAMPGPFEKHRLLALELRSGALAGASGILKPTGRKLAAEPVRKAA